MRQCRHPLRYAVLAQAFADVVAPLARAQQPGMEAFGQSLLEAHPVGRGAQFRIADVGWPQGQDPCRFGVEAAALA